MASQNSNAAPAKAKAKAAPKAKGPELTEEQVAARKVRLAEFREAVRGPGVVRVEMDKASISEPLLVDYNVGANLNEALERFGPDVVYAAYAEGAEAIIKREIFRVTGQSVGLASNAAVNSHFQTWALGTDPDAQKKAERAAKVIQNLDPQSKYNTLIQLGIPPEQAAEACGMTSIAPSV